MSFLNEWKQFAHRHDSAVSSEIAEDASFGCVVHDEVQLLQNHLDGYVITDSAFPQTAEEHVVKGDMSLP